MRALTDRFTRALHQLHADRDVAALVELFAEGATLSKLGDQNEASGRDGARRFWQEYRSVFNEIEASFTHTIAGQDSVALEWTSSGSLAGGRPFSYAGISVLVGDGTSITGFRTYYDSAAFVAPDTR
ncbi:MAG TPA: nuclear transport factor 2 family protein [Propionibacteriaceae bacterium]|nr:nuclear transport factor 2 family protein [Propionibacteriaceae bacterium]